MPSHGAGEAGGAGFGAGAGSTAASRAGGGAAAGSRTAGFAAADGGGEAGGGSGSDIGAAGCFADGAFRGAVDDFRTVVAACRAAALGSVAADGLSVSGLAVGALLGLARSAAFSAALELWGIVRLAAGASAAASAGVAFTPDLRFFSRMFAIKKRFLSPPGEDRVPFSS